MSAPMRAQVESDDAEQDSWRFAESPVETNDLSFETEQENEHTSPGPFVVRTLKDPPEIWDLVREAPSDFKPGGAFVARLTSSKTKVLLLTLSVMFVSGLGFFGVKTLRDGRNHNGAATQVQKAHDASQTVSASQQSDTATAPVNGEFNTQVSTQSNTKSSAGDAVNTMSQSTVPQPANSDTDSASADPSHRNSIQPTGERVSHFSKLAASASGGAEASSANKRAAVASGSRNADNSRPARKENEIAAAPGTSAAPQTSHAPPATHASGIKGNPSDSASPKKISDQTSNPQPTGPPTTSSAAGANAPKAKVIQWP